MGSPASPHSQLQGDPNSSSILAQAAPQGTVQTVCHLHGSTQGALQSAQPRRALKLSDNPKEHHEHFTR